MDIVTQGYQPLDLLAIQKSLPKNLKKINSDKDLESEVAEVCNTLKDISKLYTHFNFIKIHFCRRGLEKTC